MRADVGGGWYIYHITDRVVELRKDSPVYRDLTGADGFVKVRIEPEMTRDQALERATQEALKLDEQMAHRVTAQLIPTARGVGRYRQTIKDWASVFAISTEERKRYRV